MKKLICAMVIATISSSLMAQSQWKPVVVGCSFSEGKDVFNNKVVDLESPYGGGKVASFKRKNGERVNVTVMLSLNEDDRNLLDMMLLIDSSAKKSLGMISSNGLVPTSLNGISTTLLADKNGSLFDNVNVKCSFK